MVITFGFVHVFELKSTISPADPGQRFVFVFEGFWIGEFGFVNKFFLNFIFNFDFGVREN